MQLSITSKGFLLLNKYGLSVRLEHHVHKQFGDKALIDSVFHLESAASQISLLASMLY